MTLPDSQTMSVCHTAAAIMYQPSQSHRHRFRGHKGVDYHGPCLQVLYTTTPVSCSPTIHAYCVL